ncbi:GNAT family N-acetyltransferase [Gryllotalpicola koreensis]|uniref:N-acetyltransferase domain-containing protein n=1 Tax=Gryllotalpicola koreensis TaxID=993086 RepID=A0ABP7ZQ78_9MICO
MGFTVRRSTRDDWERMRKLRLEALKDTPMAFGQTYENALQMTEAEWRAYAGRGEERHRLFVVAVDDGPADGGSAGGGDFLGMMGGALDHGGGAPFLVAVFVSPRSRGVHRGVSDALLEAIEDWARGFADRLQLDVHEDNARARRFYQSRGFVETGHTMPYPLDTSRLELNMVKRLA